ncbi:hypothetical protein LCGC14_2506330 [marine sediment metagenome]|uniref:Uncharacterized protein n=1 Tax=marine sediment metagenome TaxID=412755 RepID=A0A0F9B156_9ZZZZ
MADARILTGTSSVTLGNSDQTPVDVRGTRDGAMFTAPWLTALALEGRCFGFNTGTGTAPDVLGSGYTNTKPDAHLAIPSGTTVIPVYIEVCWEDTDTDPAVMDCFAMLTTVVDTSLTATGVTIKNMRTDAPIKSLCTASAVVTTGTTPYTGNRLEFWRGTAGMVPDSYNSSTAQTSELNSRTTWSISKALVPPVFVGPSSLMVWASKTRDTSITGWITIIWAEVPSTSIV